MKSRTMQKRFVIERVWTTPRKSELHFFGDRPFTDSETAEAAARKMALCAQTPGARVFVRGLELAATACEGAS